MLDVGDAIATVPGIGETRAALLESLGIQSVWDLLLHIPRAYLDRRSFSKIGDLAVGDEATLSGTVVSARTIHLRGYKNMAIIRVDDGTGEIACTFFGRGFLANSTLKKGTRLVVSGTVSEYRGLALSNPEYEVMAGDTEDLLHTGRIVPMYRLTEGLTQRQMRAWIATALEFLPDSPQDPLPENLRNAQDLPRLDEALRSVHFPPDPEAGARAHRRFVYEELLALQLRVLMDRAARIDAETGLQHKINGPVLKTLDKSLPFQLTPAQIKVISEILRDMAAPRPMYRLLQGDVGCGKTVVALHAIAAAVDSGYQTALMAPTEILAEQHFLHLWNLLTPLGITVEFLTGSTRSQRAVRQMIAGGRADVVVGTHALIENATQFERLGLVIIDEQHRFGVGQRQRLVEKGLRPDILQMTATPIPRTLAITLYGAMDLSIIDELPPGRQPIKTRLVPAEKVGDLYRWLGEQTTAGQQAYIICPLIDESEKKALKSVVTHYEELNAGPLAGIRTALLHGRLPGEEKDLIMRHFKNREIDVLFSTTVIEVGIDVPAATTMIIEDAPNFGLTQLHQLRGRVGRGSEQSYCFLLGTPKTADGKKRIDILCRCSDGFELAEEDLKLRGPGEFFGARQAGLSDLRAADLLRDVRLLETAREDAQRLLAADPRLKKVAHRALRARVTAMGSSAV